MTRNVDGETQRLREEEPYPGEEVLRGALGAAYPVFAEFMAAIQGGGFGLVPEWRYYKDGQAWLCKATHKKKTIAWISAWDGFFKVSFFFTEQSGAGIAKLAIADALRRDYAGGQAVGRLKPLVVPVRKKGQLTDLLTLIEYKKGTK